MSPTADATIVSRRTRVLAGIDVIDTPLVARAIYPGVTVGDELGGSTDAMRRASNA